jgi:hypothetical protein
MAELERPRVRSEKVEYKKLIHILIHFFSIEKCERKKCE